MSLDDEQASAEVRHTVPWLPDGEEIPGILMRMVRTIERTVASHPGITVGDLTAAIEETRPRGFPREYCGRAISFAAELCIVDGFDAAIIIGR